MVRPQRNIIATTENPLRTTPNCDGRKQVKKNLTQQQNAGATKKKHLWKINTDEMLY